MNCPHCGKRVQIADNVLINCEQYGNSNVARTECCGHGVVVRPITTFAIFKCDPNRTEDDWGHPIKGKV